MQNSFQIENPNPSFLETSRRAGGGKSNWHKLK